MTDKPTIEFFGNLSDNPLPEGTEVRIADKIVTSTKKKPDAKTKEVTENLKKAMENYRELLIGLNGTELDNEVAAINEIIGMLGIRFEKEETRDGQIRLNMVERTESE